MDKEELEELFPYILHLLTQYGMDVDVEPLKNNDLEFRIWTYPKGHKESRDNYNVLHIKDPTSETLLEIGEFLYDGVDLIKNRIPIRPNDICRILNQAYGHTLKHTKNGHYISCIPLGGRNSKILISIVDSTEKIAVFKKEFDQSPHMYFNINRSVLKEVIKIVK